MIYISKLAGVSYENENGENRQYVIYQLKHSGFLVPGQELLFQPQPWNPFDKNAIAVFGADIKQIGFLPKDIALKVCEAMNDCIQVKIFVESVTGGEIGQLLGVNIKIVIGQIEDDMQGIIKEIRNLIDVIKNDISNTNNNCSNDSFDDDMDYFWEDAQHDWNPHDLEGQEYENWLDSLNK